MIGTVVPFDRHVLLQRLRGCVGRPYTPPDPFLEILRVH